MSSNKDIELKGKIKRCFKNESWEDESAEEILEIIKQERTEAKREGRKAGRRTGVEDFIDIANRIANEKLPVDEYTLYDDIIDQALAEYTNSLKEEDE